MDRKIAPEIIRKRRQKTGIKILVSAICIITVFTLLVQFLQSGVHKEDLTLSEVSRGTLGISVSATGKVIPFYEQVITSPISSKIISVYKKSGDSVLIGESILQLDLTTFNADIEKQKDALEMKKTKLNQQKATVESQLKDMEMQLKIDEMRLKRMEVLLRNERYLDSIGASTSDKIKQTELEFEVQTLQFRQLQLKYENQKQLSRVDIQALELDYKNTQKDASLLQKTMTEAEVRAPQAGTLTWVNDQIGSGVSNGAQLAIIADLKNFKIEGEIADSYTDKITPGNPVKVRIGRTILDGKIGNVIPSIANGMIKFIVQLDQSNNERLRPGLKVDLNVINSIREDVLQLDNRSYYSGKGDYELWVVEGNKAVKRKVELGESSYDKVEVIQGLEEGEQVIVSDMNRFSDENELKIRK